jgi:hypothetical protein
MAEEDDQEIETIKVQSPMPPEGRIDSAVRTEEHRKAILERAKESHFAGLVKKLAKTLNADEDGIWNRFYDMSMDMADHMIRLATEKFPEPQLMGIMVLMMLDGFRNDLHEQMVAISVQQMLSEPKVVEKLRQFAEKAEKEMAQQFVATAKDQPLN